MIRSSALVALVLALLIAATPSFANRNRSVDSLHTNKARGLSWVKNILFRRIAELNSDVEFWQKSIFWGTLWIFLMITSYALGEGCPGSPMTIAGPDAPNDGSQYTVTGGVEPYSWSASRGSIDSSGSVRVSGACGPSTITVTDACGNVAIKTTRMPLGEWREVYDIRNAPDHPVCEGEHYPFLTLP